MMRYLSGAITAEVMRWQHGGIMFTPEMGNAPDLSGVVWAADNGCYTAGERFSLTRFLAFLERWHGQGRCLFAVAPDVPFNAAATWERSAPVLPLLRETGYKAALAIQNGINFVEWDKIDAVFIAGTKPFKTGATAWAICQEAKRRGKWVHIARRNSLRALQEAYDMGADSVDGTFLKFAPDINWPRMQKWFDDLCEHRHVASWDSRYGLCSACGRQVIMQKGVA